MTLFAKEFPEQESSWDGDEEDDEEEEEEEEEECFTDKIETAFLRAMGKAPKEMVLVDMSQKLKDLGVHQHIPATAWPPTNAVREVATKIKKLAKDGKLPRCVLIVSLKC
jgi:hypothetical protein